MNTTSDNELMKIADAAFLSDEIPGHLRTWRSDPQWKYHAPARLIIAREIERALLARLPGPLPPDLAQELQRVASEHGNDEAVKIVQQYASILTDAGKDRLIQAIRACYAPLVVEGKTPGMLYTDLLCESEPDEYHTWDELTEDQRTAKERILSAVLAAFGRSDLPAAIARMEAVPLEELRQACIDNNFKNNDYNTITNASARLRRAVERSRHLGRDCYQ